MRFKVGSRVRNVRRPDVIGVVTSLDAPANQWKVRPEDFRITVKYPRITKTSNGKWKGGELDELPADLLLTGEKPHEAHTEIIKGKSGLGVNANIKIWDRKQSQSRTT